MALDYPALLAQWALPQPYATRHLVGGLNNVVLEVLAGNGQRYVLRIVHGADAFDRTRATNAILRGLGEITLPFALPSPLATPSGDDGLRCLDDGHAALAVLTPYLTGTLPPTDDLPITTAAGVALATLDRALATIALDGDTPPSRPTYGAMVFQTPAVPDPIRLLTELPIAPEERRAGVAMLTMLATSIPTLYATLPQQLIHGDFDESNCLVADRHIVAILDFEFCAPDLRALDLIPPLCWWAGQRYGTGAEWPILDAFVAGYASGLTLNPDEVAAMPTLMALRDATSFVYRAARWRQGLAKPEDVVRSLRGLLRRAEWMSAHRPQFLEMLQRNFLHC